VQQACRAAIERLAGEEVKHVAVDGCGAPQHALTLPGLARAFTALVLGGAQERRVADAMRAHPWHVGGTGRDVTRLMEGVPGLVAKDGAEGVYAVALADGTSVALKIADGSARTGVRALATAPVLGGGRPVGELRVTGALAT
jgi:L-asparaginase II